MLWITACNIDLSANVNNIFLCGKHFIDSDFINNQNVRKRHSLRRNAVSSQSLEMNPATNHSGRKKSLALSVDLEIMRNTISDVYRFIDASFHLINVYKNTKSKMNIFHQQVF